MTNLQRFARVYREFNIAAALRAIGVDPNATRDGTTPEGRVIVTAIATEHDIDPARIYARDRTAPIHAARVACMRAMRVRGWSYPRIGREMMRDHSTVVHACKERS